MAFPVTSATVILLLIASAAVLHSSASTVVVTRPSSSEKKNTFVDDAAPVNHVRNKEISLPTLVPKRGTGVVMIAAAAASSINGTSTVQDNCNGLCNNDYNCATTYPSMCQSGDMESGRCYIGCHCADGLCHCICSY